MDLVRGAEELPVGGGFAMGVLYVYIFIDIYRYIYIIGGMFCIDSVCRDDKRFGSEKRRSVI